VVYLSLTITIYQLFTTINTNSVAVQGIMKAEAWTHWDMYLGTTSYHWRCACQSTWPGVSNPPLLVVQL